MKIIRRVFVSLIAVSLAGCAGSPTSGTQQPTSAANNVKGFVGSDRNVEFNVVNVSEATSGWLEYVIEGRNKSSRPISNIRGIVIDETGKEFEAAATFVDVQKPPELAKDMLVYTGLGVSTMFMAVPFVGPLVMLGYGTSKMMEADDQASVARRFSKSLQGATIPGKEEGSGSFFFPAVRPSKIKVGYVIDGERKFVMTASLDSKNQNNLVPQEPAQKVAIAETTAQEKPIVLPMKEIQRRLTILGYNAGPQDGKYGSLTAQALREFQADYGINVTSMPDDATMAALNGMSEFR